MGLGLAGDFAKSLLVTYAALWVIAVLLFIFSGQIGMAVLLAIGFAVPFLMIAYEYVQYRKTPLQPRHYWQET